MLTSRKQGITYDDIATIMGEPKPNQAEKVKIPTAELRKRILKSHKKSNAA